MSFQIRLSARAAQLQQAIWASLFVGAQVTALFCKNASLDTKEVFGRIIYTIFIQRQVKGLPDIHGKPALEFDLEHAPQKLVPPGYGKEFGDKLYTLLFKKYPDVEILQDSMQTVAMQFVARPGMLKQGIDFRVAERYVAQKAFWLCRDAVRRQQQLHPDDSGSVIENTKYTPTPNVSDLDDPGNLKEIVLWMQSTSRGQILRDIQHDLQKIPGGWEYIEGVLTYGVPDTKLIGDWPDYKNPGIIPWFRNHSISSDNFAVNYKPKIKKVLKKYVELLRP